MRRPLYETPDSVRTRRLAELAKARAKWEAYRSRSYQYAAHIECFCLMAIEGKTTLEFCNDSLVRGTTPDGRLGPDALPWFKSFSIPLLFSASVACSCAPSVA